MRKTTIIPALALLALPRCGHGQEPAASTPQAAQPEPAPQPAPEPGEVRPARISLDSAGEPVKLANTTTEEGFPCWAPDSKRIAYQSMQDGDQEIHVMKADGTAELKLTDNATFDGLPSWSPDGTMIAFQGDEGGAPEILVMGADGSDPVNLSKHPDWDGWPAWSPDGRHIVFVSRREGGKNELFLVTF